jgi:putative tryptophan/tyrosine transport system substrate-binding protein
MQTRKRSSMIRRRDLLTLVGGAAAGWSFSVRAQQPTLPVIGYLSSTSSGPYVPFVTAFQQGLKETGFVAGQNVTIEYRWAEGKFDRLPALAADLVRRQVAIIAVGGGGVTALAAKDATSTIPIVFAFGSDPVKLGLVASLNRPGGNITGVSTITVELGQKRLELLHDLLPKVAAIGFLMNPSSPNTVFDLPEMQVAARELGQELVVVNARDEREIDTAFSDLVQQRAAALLVQPEPFLLSRRNQLVALTARYAIPALYFERAFPIAGGLMSYGPDLREANRQAGSYAGSILKGARPADLPVMQSTKFELVINLKTAKALGLEIPPKLLALATEVIE